jgi:four helix bundle protein
VAEESPKDIRTFRDLIAWQKAMALARCVYRLSRTFPDDEKFGRVSQMRRAGVSVPANIAEGYGRGRRLEYLRHLEIARGSLFELQTHAEVARHEGWMDGDGWAEFDRAAREVDRVLSGLLRSLKRSKGPAKA